MLKKILFIFLIFFLLTGVASAGNNTTITNPTPYVIDANTTTATETGHLNISFEDGYNGYCVEYGEHEAKKGQSFYIENTSKIINSNYIKTMFVFFNDQTQKDKIATQHMIWKFTDNKEFSKFNKTWYNQIIEIGDKYTIPDSGTIALNNTHQMVFYFKAFIPLISEFQNFFGYKIFIEEKDINSTPEINNTIVNNTTASISFVDLNLTKIEINKTNGMEPQKVISSYISKHQTGNNLWILGCLIIILLIIYILDRE